MSRIKEYLEGPPSKIHRVVRKIIKAKAELDALEQCYGGAFRHGHTANTKYSYIHLLDKANEDLLKLVKKLIKISPSYSMKQKENKLIIKVRMNNGELIHIQTFYDDDHFTSDVIRILRHME